MKSQLVIAERFKNTKFREYARFLSYDLIKDYLYDNVDREKWENEKIPLTIEGVRSRIAENKSKIANAIETRDRDAQMNFRNHFEIWMWLCEYESDWEDIMATCADGGVSDPFALMARLVFKKFDIDNNFYKNG